MTFLKHTRLILLLFPFMANAQWVQTNGPTGGAIKEFHTSDSGLANATVTSLAMRGTILFAGTQEAGVFRSANNGRAWSAINTGLKEIWITSLALNGTDLFAGTRGNGVFRLSKDGKTWVEVNNGLSNSNSKIHIIWRNVIKQE